LGNFGIGTIDFIFGDAAAVFQNCDIFVRRPMDHQGNMITAQGRDDPHTNSGNVLFGHLLTINQGSSTIPKLLEPTDSNQIIFLKKLFI